MKGEPRSETPSLAEIDEIISAHSDFLRSRMQAALKGFAEQNKTAPAGSPGVLKSQTHLEDRQQSGSSRSSAHEDEEPESSAGVAGNGSAKSAADEFSASVPDKLFRILIEQLPEAVVVLDPHNPDMPGPVAVFNGAAQAGAARKCAWTLGWPILECSTSFSSSLSCPYSNPGRVYPADNNVKRLLLE